MNVGDKQAWVCEQMDPGYSCCLHPPQTISGFCVAPYRQGKRNAWDDRILTNRALLLQWPRPPWCIPPSGSTSFDASLAPTSADPLVVLVPFRQLVLLHHRPLRLEIIDHTPFNEPQHSSQKTLFLDHHHLFGRC